jgi:hypothetical protein
MPLDPVIAGGFRGLQLQDPLEQYGRISQIQQAQQQNQLAALKMQEYQREVETENRLRALYQRPGADIRSPEFLREVYSVSPAKGAAMQKSAFEAEKEKRLSDAAMEDLAAKRIANARQMLPSVTPETWGAWRADTIQKLPGLANMIPEMYSDDAKMQLIQTADQYAASRKPMVVAPGASVFQPGSTTAAFTAPAKPETPKLSDRLVPVGKLVFDRETRQFITPPAAAIAATQERGAAAPAPAKEPAAKPLTAAQEATRRDKLGKEFKSASSALQTTQDVLDSIAAVKSSPGLSRATGFTGTMLPSFPEGEAAQAETRLTNLKGKVTALGKAAAAASGAIGSIANQEWKILADQIAAIEPVKGAGPLLEQIGLVEAQALGAMERIQDAYNRQFGEDFERFPQFRDLPPPKSTQPKGRKSGGAVTPAGAAPAPATGALSPAEQAELEQLRKLLRKGG